MAPSRVYATAGRVVWLYIYIYIHLSMVIGDCIIYYNSVYYFVFNIILIWSLT